MKISSLQVYALFLVPIALTWAKSSLGKVIQGTFPQTLGTTLEKFASNNPYPWFKTLLENTAIPQANTFGMAVMAGELFTAVAMIIGVLSIFFAKEAPPFVHRLLLMGLFVGAVLNSTFWLASSWMSPSSDGLNMIMALTQIIAFVLLLRRSSFT